MQLYLRFKTSESNPQIQPVFPLPYQQYTRCPPLKGIFHMKFIPVLEWFEADDTSVSAAMRTKHLPSRGHA